MLLYHLVYMLLYHVVYMFHVILFGIYVSLVINSYPIARCHRARQKYDNPTKIVNTISFLTDCIFLKQIFSLVLDRFLDDLLTERSQANVESRLHEHRLIEPRYCRTWHDPAAPIELY